MRLIVSATACAAGVALTIFAGTPRLAKADAAAMTQIADAQGGTRSACRADFLTYCHGIPPGGGRAIACMERNLPRLSPGCRTALRAAAASRRK